MGSPTTARHLKSRELTIEPHGLSAAGPHRSAVFLCACIASDTDLVSYRIREQMHGAGACPHLRKVSVFPLAGDEPDAPYITDFKIPAFFSHSLNALPSAAVHGLL